jgi:hypothetical protein
LNGVEATCPVGRETRMWLLSPRAVIANMIIGHEAPANAFVHTRSINVPGISIPVAGMIDALRRVAAMRSPIAWSGGSTPRSIASCRHGQ